MSIDIRIKPEELVREINSSQRAELFEAIIQYESAHLDRDEVIEWVYELLVDMSEDQQIYVLTRLFRKFLFTE